MADLEGQILSALSAKNYTPVKPKVLARRLGLGSSQYDQFRRTLRELLKKGRIEHGRNHTVRPVQPHGMVIGVYQIGRAHV